VRRLALLVLLCGGAAAQDDLRFTSVDVILDVDRPVAAWQFELTDRNGAARIVGVENGESAAFRETPYYDREAVQLGRADRIVVADYSLADAGDLPSGRFRVATLHFAVSGDREPEFELNLIAAADQDGRPLEATIALDASQGSDP